MTAICGCDIDLHRDGNRLLVVGFSSGGIELRKDQSGDVLFQTKVDGAGGIAKLFYYDYRMSGEKQVVAVTTTGKIQGFNISQTKATTDLTHDKESKEASEKQLELNRRKIELANKVQEMQEKKARLEQQLANIQKLPQGSAPEGALGLSEVGLPNVEDDIRFEIVSDLANKCTQLQLTVTKTGWIIKSVILENE